jgi:hypothetical protein
MDTGAEHNQAGRVIPFVELTPRIISMNAR